MASAARHGYRAPSPRTAGRAILTDWRSLEMALETKGEERARVLGLFRKGRITGAVLDAQLDEIDAEERSLRDRLDKATRVEPAQQLDVLANVEALLDALRMKLDEGISWELKRELVEVLVDGITIDTIATGKTREAVVNVRYKFVSSVDTCTGRGSCNKRDLSLKPECRICRRDWVRH